MTGRQACGEPDGTECSGRFHFDPGRKRLAAGTGDNLKADCATPVLQVLAEWRRDGFAQVDLLGFPSGQHAFILRVAGDCRSG
ncbi:MAG: hypothetical protein OXN89_25485 [Bryobacterales bacterium]|nr:hypothetical protein [Bryobacterales bacterium]